MTHFDFENSRVSLDSYPPAPVVWMLNLADFVCLPLKCSEWRRVLRVPSDSWLAYQVPWVVDHKPQLLTYGNFLRQQQETLGNAAASPWSPASVYNYAFQTPSTVLGDVGTPTTLILVLIFFMILRKVNATLIPYVSSLGREYARRMHGNDWVKNNDESIARFGETFYQLLCHGFLAIYGLYHFHGEEWWARNGLIFTGTKALFQGFPHQPIKPDMAWFYIFEAAYNLDAIVSLFQLSFSLQLRWPVFASKLQRNPNVGPPFVMYHVRSPIVISWSKTVRSDFHEMLFHDVLTNSLCLGSSFCRLNRVGSVVFLIHDVSAVPVKLSKLANFLKWETSTLVFFTSMLLTWLVTRIYMLPFVVLRGTLMNQHYILEQGLPPMFFICYSHAFDIGIFLLCLLQYYWFYMYVKIYVKIVKKAISKRSGSRRQIRYPMTTKAALKQAS